ncbi:MAG: glycoside hydrolase family 3 protein [Sedimentisphaerales bacterium]|nr:glycoside hydrolase family 3 protein [Sedimentisphaerales bacterium]MBN2844258.1 glycoside hydrolase family 3 protein [Sedimentisphaerales bacterium]
MKKVSSFILSLVTLALITAGCQKPYSGSQKQFTRYDRQARELLARMTLDEKIGQMIQAETTGLKDPSDIETYYLGSILAGGSADPKAGNSPEAWTDEFETAMAHSLKTRLRIPLLFGIDAVHGHNNITGATIFPHNIALGYANDPELVEEIGRATAVEMRATGIHWAFAPCVAAAQDQRWGRTYESFSADPKICGRLGAAASRGLQGDSLAADDSVLACVKHYAGDGGTAMGTARGGHGLDQGDTRCDEDTFRRLHLAQYRQAIKEGAGSIMPSYSSWNGVKCSANKYLLTDILRGELGFEGFLISDYEAIKQIDPDFKKAIAISVNAGMDMAMEPTRYREFFALLKELVQEGTVTQQRIDEAVIRILRVKFAMGLLDPDYDYKVDRSQLAVIGCQEHRDLARRAVRQSLVTLKDDDKVLDLLRKAQSLLVAGSAADDIGQQCGGWTIDWQGKTGAITTGTTILSAVKQAVGPAATVWFSPEGDITAKADVALVVIGEKPYAEFEGDRNELKLSPEDIALVKTVKAGGMPVVVILLSGRSLDMDDISDYADVIIAAWLPGTEAAGITDFLALTPDGRN